MSIDRDAKSNKILDNYLFEFASRIENEATKKNGDDCENGTILNFSLEEVKEIFQKIDWGFESNDTTYLSHDIHPYPAKFIPHIPEIVIRYLTLPGETVWDPFGGSGTTALEALLQNRVCISTDLNPIASIIGKAKTTALTPESENQLDLFIAQIEDAILSEINFKNYIQKKRYKITQNIPEVPNLEKWFSNIAISELAFIKHLISEKLSSEASINIAKASLSKIIIKASNQESETRYCSIKKNLDFGDVIRLFINDLKANIIKIKALSKVLGYKKAYFHTINVMDDIVGNDKLIKENDIDLIITSPPYPNAFDYHLYHRFRIFWLDGDPREMAKSEIGSHLQYQKQRKGFEHFISEMSKVLRNCYNALKHGRYAVFVLGDSIFEKKLYNTAEEIGKVAQSLGFEIVGTIKRPLHKTKRSMHNAARRAKDEKILVLRKKSKVEKIALTQVSYKLWKHEQILSDMEQIALLGNKGDNLKLDSSNIMKLKELTYFSSYMIGGNLFKTWQSILENGDTNDQKSRKDPKYVTHAIHPYKGKFYPQLVKPLINISGVKKGSKVFDPFCGSGTVLLEGMLNGYFSCGCDINPIAVEIAKAKTDILFVDPHILEKSIINFLNVLNHYDQRDSYITEFEETCLSEIYRWFPIKVVNKLGFILEKINYISDERISRFLRILLSSIIREISQQEPTDLRIRRRKNEIDDAPVFELFKNVILHQVKKLFDYFRISHMAPWQLLEPMIWQGSSKDNYALNENIEDNSIDLIITSPPYATALPYIDTNRLNLLILEGLTANKRIPIENSMTGTREINKSKRLYYENLIDKRIFSKINSDLAEKTIEKIHSENNAPEIGFRRKNMAALLYMYFDDMAHVFSNIDKKVVKSGRINIVIGDTKTTTSKGVVVIKTTKILQEMGLNLGWKLKNYIPINVTTENYKHIGNAITENTILIFEK